MPTSASAIFRVESSTKDSKHSFNLAALLASFALLAVAGGDAGIAALSATQALAQDNALRYSRGNEAEADRVGMTTMVDAGLDPHAAPVMFERMLQASRYARGNRVPEFLRSHPLSKNRIADTKNRAREYPKTIRTPNLSYQLMRARVANQLANTPSEAVQKFRGELGGSPKSIEATTYGLVLALTDAGRTDEARTELDALWATDVDRLEYIVADAEIDLVKNKPGVAADKLAAQLKVSPGNHALTMTYARALMKDQKPHISEEVLIEQSKRNTGDPALWYLLAEVQGLSGNIVGLHQSRAEYFILNGILDQAEKQLTYALGLTKGDFVTTAKLHQRIADISSIRENMDF